MGDCTRRRGYVDGLRLESGWTVPWGVGCTVVYNYVDLMLRNDTDRIYQLRAGVTEEHLVGALRSSAPQPTSYVVESRREGFETVGEVVYRHNEIWRVAARDGRTRDELVRRNRARIAYPLPGAADAPEPRAGE